MTRDPRKGPSEAQWQSEVLRYARRFGYRSYHTRVSFGSAKGFPDLVLCRPPRLIFAELKSDKGTVKPEQQAWLDDLAAAGQEAHVWRPRDVEAVVACLASPRRPGAIAPGCHVAARREAVGVVVGGGAPTAQGAKGEVTDDSR